MGIGMADMMPTMCEIAGAECPPTDGISMLPELLGKKDEQQKHDFLYWEYPEQGGQKAVRMGKWKAFLPDVRKGNRKVELYDLSVDPREQNDVAALHPDVIDRIHEIFRAEHVDSDNELFYMPAE